MNNSKTQAGFTLIEIMAVIVIMAVIAAIAVPKLSASTLTARRNADIATAHQVKTALDRYQVENGVYPTSAELTAANGKVTAASFIPAYISKLDTNTTQQKADDDKKGFGKAVIPDDDSDLPVATNLIMIYLKTDGSDAIVKAFNENLEELWSSGD